MTKREITKRADNVKMTAWRELYAEILRVNEIPIMQSFGYIRLGLLCRLFIRRAYLKGLRDGRKAEK